MASWSPRRLSEPGAVLAVTKLSRPLQSPTHIYLKRLIYVEVLSFNNCITIFGKLDVFLFMDQNIDNRRSQAEHTGWIDDLPMYLVWSVGDKNQLDGPANMLFSTYGHTQQVHRWDW